MIVGVILVVVVVEEIVVEGKVDRAMLEMAGREIGGGVGGGIEQVPGGLFVWNC